MAAPLDVAREPSTTIKADGHDVVITNPSKVLFPKAGYTKLDLAKYYLAVAEGAILPVPAAQTP